eukprot:CAMPEP_0114323644 /NCGR_PEP_ID=MMETSP0059-20121206/28021_1 /TAXON_ID=36894 /ORGANISM="Pyramimonas parkeae, Strain CCMP726" /LENGTH=65 /DNA_ID=CAMNT_0001452005 /DNA_START=151 /DNA_END=348 /DNA_ORIENTATION=+
MELNPNAATFYPAACFYDPEAGAQGEYDEVESEEDLLEMLATEEWVELMVDLAELEELQTLRLSL